MLKKNLWLCALFLPLGSLASGITGLQQTLDPTKNSRTAQELETFSQTGTTLDALSDIDFRGLPSSPELKKALLEGNLQYLEQALEGLGIGRQALNLEMTRLQTEWQEKEAFRQQFLQTENRDLTQGYADGKAGLPARSFLSIDQFENFFSKSVVGYKIMNDLAAARTKLGQSLLGQKHQEIKPRFLKPSSKELNPQIDSALSEPSVSPLSTRAVSDLPDFQPLISSEKTALLSTDSCHALASLGGKLEKPHYAQGLAQYFLPEPFTNNYQTIAITGPHQGQSIKHQLVWHHLEPGEPLVPRSASLRVLKIEGNPQIKAPFKIPMHTHSLEFCHGDHPQLISRIKAGVIMAETEAIALKIYAHNGDPQKNFVLQPGQEIFVQDREVCVYEGTAWFNPFDHLDEWDFWQRPRLAFSRSSIQGHQIARFYDGTTIFVDRRQNQLPELTLNKLYAWQPLKLQQILLSATALKLAPGDRVTLGLEEKQVVISQPGNFCYQVTDQLPASLSAIKKPKHKASLAPSINIKNPCAAPEFPACSTATAAQLERLKLHVCELNTKSLAARLNSIHINQPLHIPHSLANRDQNKTIKCQSPVRPSQLASTAQKSSGIVQRYESLFSRALESFHPTALTRQAGGNQSYGESSYTETTGRFAETETQDWHQALNQTAYSLKVENYQNQLATQAGQLEEAVQTLDYKNCQYQQLEKHLQNIADKPTVSS